MIEHLLKPLVSERFLNEPGYREGHIKIINALPGRRILGVHIPEMRALAKSLAGSEGALDLIDGFERAAAVEKENGCGRDCGLCYEEMAVWGMMTGALKDGQFSSMAEASGISILESRLELVRRYVAVLDNWALCDMSVSGAKWFGKAVSKSLKAPAGSPDRAVAEKLWQFLCGYFSSEMEFDIRFATVMAMSFFLNEQYLNRIFYQFDKIEFGKIRSEYVSPSAARSAGGAARVLESGKGVVPGEPPYYVNMGVAWCLATALAKFPDDTRAYMRHSSLPEQVIRLYIRKSRESFRTRDISPL